MTARYTLYGLFASAPSFKVGLMLTLCDEAFDYVHVNLREGAHKKPDYLKINRFGQVPALVDNSNGKTLCQSGAILEYLVQKYGNGRFVPPLGSAVAIPALDVTLFD